MTEEFLNNNAKSKNLSFLELNAERLVKYKFDIQSRDEVII